MAGEAFFLQPMSPHSTLLVLALALILIWFVHDVLQKKHAIIHNFLITSRHSSAASKPNAVALITVQLAWQRKTAG